MSVWNDIRKQGLGLQLKEEDKVNKGRPLRIEDGIFDIVWDAEYITERLKEQKKQIRELEKQLRDINKFKWKKYECLE